MVELRVSSLLSSEVLGMLPPSRDDAIEERVLSAVEQFSARLVPRTLGRTQKMASNDQSTA
jgi:hypothetical protein